MNGISLINFEPLPSVAFIFGGSTDVQKFSAASDSGVAICPKMMFATSPGSKLVPIKIMIETTSRVTKLIKILLMMA